MSSKEAMARVSLLEHTQIGNTLTTHPSGRQGEHITGRFGEGKWICEKRMGAPNCFRTLRAYVGDWDTIFSPHPTYHANR